MHPDIPPFLLIVFTVATTFGVLLQAGVLLGMFLGLRKTQKKIELLADDARVHLLPTIATTRTLLEDLSPKIKVIATNLVETTTILRTEASNIRVAVDDVVGRTQEQAARVDQMVSGTLDGVEHAASTLQHGVVVSIRQVVGVLNGLRAGFDALKRKPDYNGTGADDDLFV